MHNVFRLPEKRHRVVDHLTTEMDAVSAARNLAVKIAEAGKQSEPIKHIVAISRAGLLGISVPSEQGGADIANAVLAEIVAILSESDLRIGTSLMRHFQVVEAIRLFATEGQQAVYFAHALAGEHFALATSEQETGEKPTLVPDRTGFCLQAPVMVSASDHCDWIAVPALEPKGQHVLALLAREAEELSLRWMPDADNPPGYGVARLDLSDCHVQADALIRIALGPEGLSTLKPLGKLLQGAVDLGIARAIFTDLRHHLNQRQNIDTDTHAAIGRLFARIEGVAALIERAGQKLDVAQVNSTDDSIRDAFLLASAVAVLASDAVRQVRAKSLQMTTLTPMQPPERAAAGQGACGADDQLSEIVLGQFHADGKLPALSPFG